MQSLQALSETRTSTLNGIWSAAANLENQTLTRSVQLVEHLSTEIPRNNPVLDSMMYVRHNVMQWTDPPDFGFEPSPVWLDDDTMANDPQSKTFLMNILSKSKNSLGPLRKETEAKRREVEGAKRVRLLIREGKDKRDEVEVVRSLFYISEMLHEVERRCVTAEVEVSTITSAMGDISIGMRNHAFKNQTFKIPTNCDLCGDRIWGLSAKGLSCTDCGYTCHVKCELKVAADCPGELDKEARKAIKAERQAAAASSASAANGNGDAASIADSRGSHPGLQRSDTMGSMSTLSSGYAASAHRSASGATVKSPAEEPTPKPTPAPGRHRIVAPPPASFINASAANGDSDEPRGKMLYPYQANGDGEITVPEGQEFAVVEPDGKPILTPTTCILANTSLQQMALAGSRSAPQPQEPA